MLLKIIIKSQTKLLVWLMFFIPASVLPVGAQNYFFDSYSNKQGLSEQKVYVLLQDSKDFIWLGTANGLSRFDGMKFENFSLHDNLAPGGVQAIFEDTLGYIWFGHLKPGGISRYDGQIFEQAAFDSIKITGEITSITQINNKIWFTSTNDGAIQADFPIRDIKHIKARQFRGKAGLSDRVYGADLKKDRSYICITDAGLRKYNAGEQKFENYRMPHMTTYFNTTCLLEDKKGNLWFGTDKGGLYKYIMSESRMEVIDLPKAGVSSNTVSCLTEDSKGRIWVGTFGGGIVVFDGEKMLKFNSGNGLKASKIYDIIEDVEGNILIADYDNGLTIFKGEAFETINEKEILPDPNVNAIFKDTTGSIWFGTNGGITRYYPDSGKKPDFYNYKNSSVYEDVRFFRKDRDGNLWIGSTNQGVILYNMKSSRFEDQPYINSILIKGVQVTSMEIDKKNNLWIGTLDGLVIGKIGEENFRHSNFIDSLIIGKISALYCDHNGNVWIGTESMRGKPGLIKYDSSKDDFKRVPALSGLIPRALVMDRKGVLWIGTSEGLKAFRNDSIILSITQNDGLLSNNINLITIGDDGSIYIGTNNGLNRYFPDSKRIFSYTERNGFPGIETKPNAVFKSTTGDLWFGTANGATRLNPSEASTRSLEPLTHLMNMQVNYETPENGTGTEAKL